MTGVTQDEREAIERMVESTAAGFGLARDPGRAERKIEIHVDHVYGDIATATVTSAVYVDYL